MHMDPSLISSIKRVIPMLNVANLQRSLDFYRQVVGFEPDVAPDIIEQWKWASIQAGGAQLMVCEAGGPPQPEPGSDSDPTHPRWPTIFYFYAENVEALYQHVKGLGYEVTPLEIKDYQMKEFSLRDPDGHLLSFGQEVA